MLASPVPMHIPDGFLSVLVALFFWAATAIVVAYALKRVNTDLGERQVPLMGVLAACIFAGQMLNFNVAAGTSGHLVGAALATIMLGPWASILIMTCVIAVQGLIFQDGGLLAMGANIFNMGIVATAVAYATYRLVARLSGGRAGGMLAAAFLSAWASIVVTSLAVGLQLALSGTSPANLAIPAMGGVHLLIGIGEGLITVGAVSFLRATRRDMLEQGTAPVRGGRGILVAGLALALALAVVSPLASADPDGLEWFAEQQHFTNRQVQSPIKLIPDYRLPGIGSEAAATIASGVVGMLIVFGAAGATAYIRRNRKNLPAH
ncbi:MAG: energy-coupling factor ABC transporter permease [Chloroflexi bacterium]|nr:energy-coupling factor ABC transporter permease [Chloroflexota bacterium]